MKITVEFRGPLRATAGAATAEVTLPAGATLRAALETLEGQHEKLRGRLWGAEGAAARAMLILINDTQAPRDGFAPLQDGDRVTLMPPVGGG